MMNLRIIGDEDECSSYPADDFHKNWSCELEYDLVGFLCASIH
jgi:hypothetical protein